MAKGTLWYSITFNIEVSNMYRKAYVDYLKKVLGSLKITDP